MNNAERVIVEHGLPDVIPLGPQGLASITGDGILHNLVLCEEIMRRYNTIQPHMIAIPRATWDKVVGALTACENVITMSAAKIWTKEDVEVMKILGHTGIPTIDNAREALFLAKQVPL